MTRIHVPVFSRFSRWNVGHLIVDYIEMNFHGIICSSYGELVIFELIIDSGFGKLALLFTWFSEFNLIL